MESRKSQFFYTTSAKASLFDIVAEDSLRTSLKPAWSYLCKTLSVKYPSQLLRKYSDEIFYVLILLLEEYSLRNKSASLTESFYELRRECTSPATSFVFRHAKFISLLTVVGLPYVMDKLQNRYNQIKEDIIATGAPVSRIDMMLYKYYPIILTITKWIRMANYMLYLFNYTGYAMPLLHLTHFQLKYVDKSLDNSLKPQINENRSRLIRMLQSVPDFTSAVFTKLAPAMFYSLQFLNTYYGEDTLTQKDMTTVPVSEPPETPKVSKYTNEAKKYFIRRNFRERNFREFREFWPFSRKFISRKFSKWQFAKVYPVKFF